VRPQPGEWFVADLPEKEFDSGSYGLVVAWLGEDRLLARRERQDAGDPIPCCASCAALKTQGGERGWFCAEECVRKKNRTAIDRRKLSALWAGCPTQASVHRVGTVSQLRRPAQRKDVEWATGPVAFLLSVILSRNVACSLGFLSYGAALILPGMPHV